MTAQTSASHLTDPQLKTGKLLNVSLYFSVIVFCNKHKLVFACLVDKRRAEGKETRCPKNGKKMSYDIFMVGKISLNSLVKRELRFSNF